jgi:outer membrane lipoprotein-sorting protein
MKKLFAILPLLICTAAYPQSDNAAEIMAKSKQYMESLKDFSAQMFYSIENPTMAKPVLRTGRIKYKAGKFVIQMPDQEVYCDGVTQWVFIPDKDAPEVTIMHYDPEEPWIESIFQIYSAGSESRYDGTENIHGVNCHKVYLAIKDPGLDYNQAYVWINASSYFMEKTVLIDRRQTQTTYEFSDVKTDQDLSDSEFRFDPGKHTDITIFDER